MNVYNGLKRITLGLLSLGLSATLIFVPTGTNALAAASPDFAAMNELAPDKEPNMKSAAKDEKKRRKCFFLFEDAASVIGMDKKELKSQLEAGKSIADIAKTKGIEEMVLINRMLAIRTQKIDDAVKSGKWPQEKAERIKEKMPEHLKTMVNRKDWKEWQKNKEHHHKKGKETHSHPGGLNRGDALY